MIEAISTAAYDELEMTACTLSHELDECKLMNLRFADYICKTDEFNDWICKYNIDWHGFGCAPSEVTDVQLAELFTNVREDAEDSGVLR